MLTAADRKRITEARDTARRRELKIRIDRSGAIQCQGTTRSGKDCTAKTADGSGFCGLHRSQMDDDAW